MQTIFLKVKFGFKFSSFLPFSTFEPENSSSAGLGWFILYRVFFSCVTTT